ncbi:hypothetical protein L7F22_045206 [Adiantum nelumboides]|nr:hypothetical protein [Adiantum nelumboides]
MALWCNSKPTPQDLHSCLCGHKLPPSSSSLYPAATKASPGGGVVMNSSTSSRQSFCRVIDQESPRSRLPAAGTVSFEEKLRKKSRSTSRLPVADPIAFEHGVRNGFRNSAPQPSRTVMTRRESPPEQDLRKESRGAPTTSKDDLEVSSVEPSKAHLTQTRYALKLMLLKNIFLVVGNIAL